MSSSQLNETSSSRRSQRQELRTLFDNELDEALTEPEIKASIEQLPQIPGVDADYLRRQCQVNRERLWEAVKEQVDELDFRESTLKRAKSNGFLYKISTTPYQLRSFAILAAALGILAFVQSTPGKYQAKPNYVLLYISCSLAFLSLILPATSGFRGVPRLLAYRIQAAAFGATVAFFWSSVISIQAVGRQDLKYQNNLLLFYGICLALIPALIIPFCRVYTTNFGPSTANLGLDAICPALVVLGFLAVLVSALLAGGKTAAVVVFPKPSIAFIILAALLGSLGLLMSLIGIKWQPLPVLVDNYNEALEEARKSLRIKGILPSLRTVINERQASDSELLDIPEAPGLSEYFDPLYEINTISKQRIDQLIERMPSGGSIGVAGPRGVGKSTLLRSYCSPQDGSNDSLTVLLSAPVEYTARDFLLHLYATLCSRVLERSRSRDRTELAYLSQGRRQVLAMVVYGIVLLAAGAFLIMLQSNGFIIANSQIWGTVILLLGVGFILQSLLRRRPSGIRVGSTGLLSIRASNLEDLAADRLEEIRFQQTISATWFGTIKSPIGLEGALGGSRNLARQAMLLPEIVDSLRIFLESAAQHSRVIIGIDELDKMESDERAKQFLNEIKGVFGAKNCYFLVSVSEEAIGNFERRGIPFRDVFDSSFDEIVRVRCLELHEAAAVLNRRVTRMPNKFKNLCFCRK